MWFWASRRGVRATEFKHAPNLSTPSLLTWDIIFEPLRILMHTSSEASHEYSPRLPQGTPDECTLIDCEIWVFCARRISEKNRFPNPMVGYAGIFLLIQILLLLGKSPAKGEKILERRNWTMAISLDRVYVNTCVCAQALPITPTVGTFNGYQRVIYQIEAYELCILKNING